MNTKEKKLFMDLCKFKDAVEITEDSITQNATPELLGELFFNRMQGVAYGTLMEKGLLGKVNREFRVSLANAYDQNIEHNKSFYKCLDKLTGILSNQDGKYVMLKGALLCGKYPKGYRTSNDIDLLVCPDDVTEIGSVLNDAGFVQGHIRNGNFIKATREEIIESKMMRGETVPYILQVDMPFMKYLEVDINFSLDYKNSKSSAVSEMIKNHKKIRLGKHTICTLDDYDFFIHLCLHLFKEATTYPWIEMKRDMTLYKYLDIYMLYADYGPTERKKLFERMEIIGVTDICSAVLIWVDQIFSMGVCTDRNEIMDNIDPQNNILLKVTDPERKRIYYYTEEDAQKRLFAKNRTKLLKEKIL